MFDLPPEGPTTRSDPLSAAARAFISEAWAALEEQHVVPPPFFHPYLAVGRDYFGPDLMGRPGFVALEQAITAAAPRFSDTVRLSERDFANGYIFSFLQSFIARLTRSGEPFSTDGPAADEAIAALRSSVGGSSWEVACCRHVIHLTTATSGPVEIGGVTVIPLTEPPHGSVREADEVISSVIWGAVTAFGRDRPVVYAPPDSIVVGREEASNPFDQVGAISGRIEHLLLMTRLLHAATCESVYEVQGETQSVRRFTPTLVRFRGTGASLMGMATRIRRTARLSEGDSAAIEGLSHLMTEAEGERPGMAITSFGMAFQKYQLSYHAHAWYEQITDLATAFEASLSGKDKADVLLRLRTRAAALLSTERDPARAIFGDIGQLYDLRSTLVHGGELKEKDLLKTIRSISTVPETAPYGVAVEYVVDRLRDLVRRSLLARICLAAGQPPLWRLGDDPGVDAALADDATRTQWRAAWRTRHR